MDNLAEYFQTRTNERSNRAIATAIGAEPSTLNRQLTGATSVTIETVVAICRHYHLDLADAFIAAGFITPEEAEAFADSHTLRRVSDLELAREIVRRLEDGTAGLALTDPIGDVANGNVTPITKPLFGVGAPGEDQAAARTTDPDDGEDR